MDELAMLRELGRELYARDPGPRDSVRARVTAVTAVEGTAAPRLSGSRLFRTAQAQPGVRFSGTSLVRDGGTAGWTSRGRLVVPLVAAVLVGVLAITVAVLLRPARDRPAPVADARQRLIAAARSKARDLPFHRPPATSFIYVRQNESGLKGTTVKKRTGTVVKKAVVYRPYNDVVQYWRSVDGSQSTMFTTSTGPDARPTIVPGCRNGLPKVHFSEHTMIACTPQTQYAAGFPITVAGARARLYATDRSDEAVFQACVNLLFGQVVTPAARAAVIQVMVDIPGVVVGPGTTTFSGVTGVLVSRPPDPERLPIDRMEVLVDPDQLTIVGKRTILIKDIPGAAAGSVLDSRGVIEKTVVPTLGVRPDGTTWNAPPAK